MHSQFSSNPYKSSSEQLPAIQEQKAQSSKLKGDSNNPPNVREFIYAKTKSFWLEKITQARAKNNHQETVTDQPSQSPPPITEVIKSGLYLQQYLQKNTNFFKLYLQQIKDYVQYNSKKKRFVPKAITMLKLFLKKNKHAAQYFYHRTDWVEQGLRAYPYIADSKLCIQFIMQNLVHKKYQKYEDFTYDMEKMFNDCMLYNFNNKKTKEFIAKIKEDWEITKIKVQQLTNFCHRQLINHSPEMLPEMMDINQEIKLLKRKVLIWNSKVEEADYEPDYFEKHGLQKDNKQLEKSSQQSKSKLSETKKKGGRPKFESGGKKAETVTRERMLQLKSNISKRIQEQIQDKDKSNRKLLQYIRDNSKRNSDFLGQNNQINLENLAFEDFVLLEAFVKRTIAEE